MHDDKIEGEEQLPSPTEEKQTGAPFEEQQKQTPPRPQRERVAHTHPWRRLAIGRWLSHKLAMV